MNIGAAAETSGTYLEPLRIEHPVPTRADALSHPAVWRLRTTGHTRPLDLEGAVVDLGRLALGGAAGEPGRRPKKDCHQQAPAHFGLGIPVWTRRGLRRR